MTFNLAKFLSSLHSFQICCMCVNYSLHVQNCILFIVQDEEVQLEASSTGAMSSDVSQLEVNDAEIQLIEQEKMLLQLKDMIRDREQSLAKKDAELQV